jgi:hypothetical protein
MTRIHRASLLSSLTLAGLEAACSGAHTEPAYTGDAGVTATAERACTIVPADYDQSCSSDSDCAAVLPGGSTCEPCDQSYLFTCGQAPINAGAATAYTAALTKALPAAPGIQFAVTACGSPASCPMLEVPACVHGQCAIVPAAEDAGR